VKRALVRYISGMKKKFDQSIEVDRGARFAPTNECASIYDQPFPYTATYVIQGVP
jgi:hypothetical protein